MAITNKFLSFLVFCLLNCSIVASTTCYWRDGNATLEGYTPCNNSGASACCLIAGGDVCTSLGLCNTSYTLNVEACTDPTWKSAACSPLCTGQPDGLASVTQCKDGSFCCATDESCCSKHKGFWANGTAVSTSSSSTSSNSTFEPSEFHLVGAPKSWHFIVENAWLSTAIIAALGWINTWIINMLLAKNKGLDPRHVADSRYAGLAKRTTIAAFLADAGTSDPKYVIGYHSADPGISSHYTDLGVCSAGAFGYIMWFVTFLSAWYAVFMASFVWSRDNSIKYQSAWLQFPLLLGVLNINRNTYAIAVSGCFMPGPGDRKRLALICTTVLALVLDVVFISRAFLMAYHINNTAPAAPSKWTGGLAWALPAVEGFIFLTGILFGYFNITMMKAAWFIFWIPNFWLFVGPLFIIGVSIASHFNQAFLGVA